MGSPISYTSNFTMCEFSIWIYHKLPKLRFSPKILRWPIIIIELILHLQLKYIIWNSELYSSAFILIWNTTIKNYRDFDKHVKWCKENWIIFVVLKQSCLFHQVKAWESVNQKHLNHWTMKILFYTKASIADNELIYNRERLTRKNASIIKFHNLEIRFMCKI